jgi:hypothetical protein
MTTLAEMRTRVRDFVRDTNADVSRRKVSDTELDIYLRESLAEYSYRFPDRGVDDNVAAASVSPPSDMVPGEDSVSIVEVSSSTYTQHHVAEGEDLPTTGKYWYWRGGTITFSTTPTATISVWYQKQWPFPTGDAVAFTVPIADEELIELYAAIKFHQKLGTVAAKLDRFKERGERDDNPLVMMHEVLRRQYDAICQSRMPSGAVTVRRGGR